MDATVIVTTVHGLGEENKLFGIGMYLAIVNDVMAKQHKCNTISVRKVDLTKS